MSVSTKDLMNAALKLAGLTEMPDDTDITVAGDDVKKVLIGVDMETSELLLAKELGYDCVVTHHPKNDTGDFLNVMDDHITKMIEYGVPANKAQKLLKERTASLSYNFHVSNRERSASAARLMNMPYMSIHTPADIIGERKVQALLDQKFGDNPKATLKEVVEALDDLNEYKKAKRKPVIRVGSDESYAGKICVTMTGGTGPGAKVLKAFFDAGVGTLVMMHIPEADAKELKEQNLGNVVIAGHMSSDSIGINAIVDEWEKMGVSVTVMSGIIR